MSISDIVQVTVTAATASLERTAFSVPLLVGYHTHWNERTRVYTKLADMVSDGFTASSPLYKMASALKRQNPSVRTWKVGRRALPAQQTLRLTPLISTEGSVLSLTVQDTEISYTIPGAATINSIATALTALIDAVSGVTAADGTGYVTITPTTANALLRIGYVSRGLKIKDNTPDPGIATDLAAIEADDPAWYTLLIDSESEAQIAAAGAWVAARSLLFPFSCIDSELYDAGVTTDIASDLKALSNRRVVPVYTVDNQEYAACALAGRMLPFEPGSATWAGKELAGVTPAALTGSQIAALRGKNCGYYISIKGLNRYYWGLTSQGEYADITQSLDWLQARIEERFYKVFVDNAKLAYSEATADLIRAEILAQFKEGTDRNVLLPNTKDTPHVVNIPPISSIDSLDKANRLLPDIQASAYLAGAIHTLQIEINLSL